jgi:hypothetical protein
VSDNPGTHSATWDGQGWLADPTFVSYDTWAGHPFPDDDPRLRDGNVATVTIGMDDDWHARPAESWPSSSGVNVAVTGAAGIVSTLAWTETTSFPRSSYP